MPTPTRIQIADRIGDLIDTISSSIIPSKYRYMESAPASFPASMIRYGGSTVELLDTVNNLVTFVFDVAIVFPNDESAAAQEKWQAAYDAVMATLNTRTNIILSGDSVDFRVEGDDKPVFSAQFSQPVAVLNIRTMTKVVQSI